MSRQRKVKPYPHTPGTWVFATDAVHSAELVPVCILYTDDDYASLFGQWKANGNLIAAAPDLLAACESLQMEAAARGCGLKIADDAIAKAKGPVPS